jgi:outer membrane protein assembly factor BamB
MPRQQQAWRFMNIHSFPCGFAAVLLTLTPLAPASATDWPQWRGPARDELSAEKGLLKAWPAGGPALAWKATGLGAGFSSVAVVQGRIYTMGDGPNGGVLRALDEATGKSLWVSEPVGKTGGGPAGTRSTPTVSGDLVYGLGQWGDLVCVEAATGLERWRRSLTKEFGGGLPGWQYSESPLVDGDRVFCTPGGGKGAIIALNKKTGELVWQSKEFKDSAHYSSMIAVDLGGQRQCIQLTPASVVGLAVEDGRVLWRADRKGKVAVVPTPIFHENHVFVTSGYGVGCNLFKVEKAGGEFTVEQVYANQDMVDHHGGVVLLGDHLYGHSDSKGWVCMEFKTGKVVWTNKGVGKGALTCAEGRLYLRSEDKSRGTLALIEATPEGYRESGRFQQPDLSGKETWAHPVVANGKLYIRDQDLLLCYDIKAR